MEEESKPQSKKYVLTGGPGVGKSTLIGVLAARGYQIVPEAARIIIEEQQISGGNIFPWTDLFKFQELVVEQQILNEKKADPGQVFLDRGIIDGHAYCRLGHVIVPRKVSTLEKGHYDKIFLLKPLPSYQNDSVRKENLELGIKIHEAIKKSYKEFGYEVCEVPVMSPEDRVDFILGQLS